MKRFVVFFALICTPHLLAEDHVAQKIDTAIEFANAGRGDLALQQLQKLLQTSLTPLEKASVLYNSAVIFATSDRYWEAMLALNQIDDDMFDKVIATSPLEAVQIAYNGAVCCTAFAKGQMIKLVTAKSYSQKELDHIALALDSAHHYSNKLDMLSEKKVMGDVAISAFLARTQLQEDIANMTNALVNMQALAALELLDKTALLDELAGLLQQQFYAVADLYVAQTNEPSSKAFYIQAYGLDELGTIVFAIDRLQLYLQAPAKKEVADMHAFFATELQVLQSALKDAYSNGDILQVEYMLDRLSCMVLLIQAELTKTQNSALLDMQLAACMEYELATNPLMATLWQSLAQQRLQFFVRFLAKRASSLDAVEAQLATLLQKRLKNELELPPNVERAADDVYYWKILSQSENVTYKDLAATLHAAPKVDFSRLAHTVNALLDRLSVLQVDEAKPPLAAMLSEQSTLVLFQNAIESWFYVEPQEALSFMFGLLSDECSALHVNPSIDSFTARTDYHLTLHLLSLVLKNDNKGILTSVYNDLVKKASWFTDKDKKDLDFFTISLELGWLKEMLTGQTENLEGITHAVDFGVDYQKKTMSLLRYAQTPEFQSVLDLLSEMQQNLAHSINRGLNTLEVKGPKIKQVIKLTSDAELQTKTQNKELASMQKVLDDLEQASKILHSMQSESQSQSNQSKASQAQAPSQASEQMQKQALKLTPNLSIRLLQEMEREDKSLQTQNIPQVTGSRPW